MAALMGGMGAPHRPVLLRETIELLRPERGGLFVDATLGLGGHAQAILEASEEARVIGIDRDREALALATERLARFGPRFRTVHANFRDLARVMEEAGETEAMGVLVDLGVSSLQFDAGHRGFSFRHNAPLDMRMDAEGDEETAAELLGRLPEEEIARVIYEYGEERRSRRIAKWIVERRERGEPIRTTLELAELVARAVGPRRTDHIHPATRTFQALRIAVNHELEGLSGFVETAVDLLQAEGRFAAISFHSLEDRIIKRALRRLSGQCECPPRAPVCSCGARRTIEILTRRPIVPGQLETDENPRARSAKLRAARKLDPVAGEAQ
ncbi:MAG TPA: 16S rRNA (cytosine(1402)-N(4))-methyltransferase RsmH [Pyrinomonadaceae bacterium]|jgi:16S rRNA (cytosine1402-N4)-methyltransferase|nr:16S rRNA (cytosine(1402)-N(4))-methyltransferase RsmH [Pyrinomonadaceae bacterium]